MPTEGVEYTEFLEHKYRKLIKEKDKQIKSKRNAQPNYVKQNSMTVVNPKLKSRKS
jgi:hypothetical protein